MAFLFSLISSIASGEAADAVRRARIAAIVFAVAGLFALLGAAFLIGAGYIAAASHYGAVNAALGFAAGFLVASGLIVLVHKIASRTRKRNIARRRKSELTSVAATAALLAVPTLLSGKGRMLAILAPLALVAYAIINENRGNTGDEDSPESAPRRKRQ